MHTMYMHMHVYIHKYIHTQTHIASYADLRQTLRAHTQTQHQLPHPAFPSQAGRNENPLDKLYISKNVDPSTSYT